jgi:ATP-dependent DNA ligase
MRSPLGRRLEKQPPTRRKISAVASAAPLPQPMLARSGSLPTRSGYAFEVKWDGFRCLLSTEERLRIVSRRGWEMTPVIPELATFPVFGTFDGELVAFDENGSPDFPLICSRLLNRHQEIRLTYVIFDVLTLNGESLMHLPYGERRPRLESLNLNGPYWQTPETFDDGEALFDAVCERELEGIVAKRLSGRYTPGCRGSWIKVKNRDYCHYEIERESAINKTRHRILSDARTATFSRIEGLTDPKSGRRLHADTGSHALTFSAVGG